MFQTIKDKTSLQHASLEKELIAKLRAVRTAEDYARLLTLFLHFYQPLENSINEHLQNDVIHDIAIRRKAAWLEEDLQQLPHVEIFGTPNLPEITNISQAIGAMYVMEGSTLGGHIISAMLRKALPGHNDCFSFFTGYGEKNMQMWQLFKTQVTEHQSKIDQEQMIMAASETFDGLRSWFQQQYSYAKA